MAGAPQTNESVPNHYKFMSDLLEPKDYALIGDVVSVSMQFYQNILLINAFLQMIPAGGDDPDFLQHRPHIQITGVIEGVGKNCEYWDMKPAQYVQGFIDNPKAGQPRQPNPTLPVRIVVPTDSPQWSGNRKPQAKTGTYAAVSGTLAGIVRDKETGHVVRILVDLGNLVYFGKAAFVPESLPATQGPGMYYSPSDSNPF